MAQVSQSSLDALTDSQDLVKGAFLSAQAQPDQHLIRLSEVLISNTEQAIKVKCSPATARALNLQRSENLPEWSHEVEVH